MDGVEPTGPVLLFDGLCNLCNSAVRFVKRRDPRGRVRLVSLQSEAGRALLESYGSQLGPEFAATTAGEPKALVLVVGDRAYAGSTAALRLTRYLSGAWPLLYPLLLVPRGLRDAAYGLVARNRYRWFGAACELSETQGGA